MGSCSNSSVQLHEKHRTPEMQTEQAKSRRTALGAMKMGSCSNSSVQLQKEDTERLRCKLSRLKRAGELDETGSDWMLLVLCDNGFVFQTALFSSRRRTQNA